MQAQGVRRGDRISLMLPIQVSGTDCMGEGFLEQTQTVILSRHGAKILLHRKLVPDQEVSVRCLETARESDARVVGQIGGDAEGFYYGIELLDLDVNLWGIDFPSKEDPETAVGRILLECVRCHTRELVYLNEFEAEVLEANHYLTRHCRRCTDSSLWRETRLQPGEELPAEALRPKAPPPRRTRNDRKHVRLDLKIDVCIRHPQFGEDIVLTENVSRGGFRFKSRKQYREGWLIEAALPYSLGGANIFTPAKIVYAGELPEGGGVYGVAYVPRDAVRRAR